MRGISIRKLFTSIKKMVWSGRSPIVQITKLLGEIENTFEINAGELSIQKLMSFRTKKPSNMHVLNDLKCCEVIQISHEMDEFGKQLFLCRVFERREVIFNTPCDSRLLVVHKQTCTYESFATQEYHKTSYSHWERSRYNLSRHITSVVNALILDNYNE